MDLELIRTAIRQKRQIHGVYQNRRRELCPHALGRDDDGEWKLVAYQFGGESSQRLSPDGSADNWRCLFVSRLQHVELVKGPWHTAHAWTFSPRPGDQGKACYTVLDTIVAR